MSSPGTRAAAQRADLRATARRVLASQGWSPAMIATALGTSVSAIQRAERRDRTGR